MKFANTNVYNFKNAFRGMRNPKNSWHLSDSWEKYYCGFTSDNPFVNVSENANYYHTCVDTENSINYLFVLGENDLKLAQSLIKAGSVHRKFMRQIFVSVDITAPLYWWKEFDTYKVGTVSNSTSTMHKLASTPITESCFEMDDFVNIDVGNTDAKSNWDKQIAYIEELRVKYNETKDKRYWKELIRTLPDSWLQTRTVTMNYEVLYAICQKDCRRNHKLNEWSGIDDKTKTNFITWCKCLPFADELLFISKDDK